MEHTIKTLRKRDSYERRIRQLHGNIELSEFRKQQLKAQLASLQQEYDDWKKTTQIAGIKY